MIRTGKCPDGMSEKEINTYKQIMTDKYPTVKDGVLDIELIGGDVDLVLTSDPVRFQRIRRITGYLVGTLDRFNNAKRHEVEDRVKHNLQNKED